MARTRPTALAAAALLVTAALSSTAAASVDLRGISPELQERLRAAPTFSCDAGARVLPTARLNDNYCDCADGADEPGTSACSHTRAAFHCANAGYFPTAIPTSRVNDGLCDCCDGSDEYATGAACPADACSERMAAFHAERAEQLRVLEDGERERHEMETRAAAAVAEAQENVTALDAAAQSLRVQLEQLEARAEEEERVEREQREKLVLEKEDALLEQLGLSQLTQRQLATLVLDLARHRISSSGDVVARVHAAREKAAAALSDEQEVAQTLKDATAMDDAASAFKLREDTRRRETKRIERRIEERRQKKEKREQEAREAAEAQAKAEAESGEMPPPAPEQANEEEEEEELVLPEEEPHPLDVLLEALTESEKFSRTETSVARDARDEVKRQLSTEEKSLETAKSVLSKNYGPDSIFLPLRDECVESAPGGAYTYKICFFGKATQDRTSLGNMKDLPVKDSEAAEEDAGEENPYRLEFTGGTKCWNGPQRSLAVDIECGALPMELYDIEEPSTCVYKAKLRAPIACDAQHREEVMAPPTEIVQAAAATAPHHIEVEVPAIL